MEETTALPQIARARQQNHWFAATPCYSGPATAILSNDEGIVSGHANVQFHEDGTCAASIEVAAITGKYAGSSPHVLLHRRCLSITIETEDGQFSSFSARICGSSTSPSLVIGSIDFCFDEATFSTNNTSEPRYWITPLLNMLTGFTDVRDEVHKPLPWMGLRGWWVYSTRFRFDGQPAVIEPTLDYEERSQRLKASAPSKLITAAIIGDLGTEPQQKSLADWKRSLHYGLLPVLGFATGSAIGAAWLEFRDVDRALVRRHHFDWAAESFIAGHQIIFSKPNVPEQSSLGRLLDVAQQSKLFGTYEFYMMCLRTMKSGRKIYTVEELFHHVCVVFDDLFGTAKIGDHFLLPSLEEPLRTNIKEIIGLATDKILEIEQNIRSTDDGTADTIHTIAEIVRNAGNREQRFGKGLLELLSHPGYEFADGPILASYTGFKNSEGKPMSWKDMLNFCRNTAMHDKTFKETDDRGMIGRVLNHLRDLLIRMIFRQIGYDGVYNSPVHTHRELVPVTWVTSSSTPYDLGFDLPS